LKRDIYIWYMYAAASTEPAPTSATPSRVPPLNRLMLVMVAGSMGRLCSTATPSASAPTAMLAIDETQGAPEKSQAMDCPSAGAVGDRTEGVNVEVRKQARLLRPRLLHVAPEDEQVREEDVYELPLAAPGAAGALVAATELVAALVAHRAAAPHTRLQKKWASR